MKSYQQRSMLNTKNPIGPAEQLSLGKKKMVCCKNLSPGKSGVIAFGYGQEFGFLKKSHWFCYSRFMWLNSFVSEIIPLYGMSSYITREDQYTKPQHKKLKDRQIDRQNRLNSPPSSIYKSHIGSCTTVYNGYAKSHNGASSGGGGGGGGAPAVKKPERRARSSPKSNEQDPHGKDSFIYF